MIHIHTIHLWKNQYVRGTDLFTHKSCSSSSCCLRHSNTSVSMSCTQNGTSNTAVVYIGITEMLYSLCRWCTTAWMLDQTISVCVGCVTGCVGEPIMIRGRWPSTIIISTLGQTQHQKDTLPCFELQPSIDMGIYMIVAFMHVDVCIVCSEAWKRHLTCNVIHWQHMDVQSEQRDLNYCIENPLQDVQSQVQRCIQ